VATSFDELEDTGICISHGSIITGSGLITTKEQVDNDGNDYADNDHGCDWKKEQAVFSFCANVAGQFPKPV
jgi:hypothetical protein